MMQMDLRFEEPAKFRSGDGVEAARWFVEKQDLGLVEQRTQQAEALESAGGESPNLAVEAADEFEALCQLRYASSQDGIGEVVQSAKKTKVLTPGETRIETEVGSSVMTEMAADGCRVAHRVASGNEGSAARGD